MASKARTTLPPADEPGVLVGGKLVTASAVTRELVRRSYYEFVREFWSQVVPEKPVWNWHIGLVCDELQALMERVFAGKPAGHDLVLNLSPGSTKSLLCSVFLCPWAWTRMPAARFICGSYSYPLAVDLSAKARDVVRSDRYRRLFPEVELRPDQDAKGNFGNTAGGYRYAVGVNGSVTGKHAHCFPREVRVLTSAGWVPIGRVVDERMRVHIMTFDHATGQARWRPVECYQRRQGGPVDRVRFDDGSSIELTGDHPVFVVGQGYVPARDLLPGDEVIDVRENSGDVRQLRQGPPDHRQTAPGVQEWEGVLLSGVSTPEPAVPRPGVSGVQEDVPAAQREELLLLDRLPVESHEREKSLPVAEAGGGEVRLVRGEVVSARGEGGSRSELALLSGVRGPVPLAQHAGGGQLQLPAWPKSQAVLAGIRPGAAENPPAGALEVLSVPQDDSRRGQETVRPPHRLRQGEQLERESGRPVPGVSRGDAHEERSPPHRFGKRVVRAVDREVRVAPAVYNLQVAEDRNYFAEGVLVHNCLVVDDPLDPQMAASDLDLKACNHWLRETLPTRKVDKAVTPTVLVMQRLRQGDPTDLFLDRGGVRHVCLPAELGPNVSPPELAKNYADGLMDPVRLSRDVLDRARRDLGAVAYAGQFGQAPAPPGGTLFEVDRAQPGVPPARMVRMARFWDKAATAGGGDYTAGVLMGVGGDGAVWVLDVVRARVEPAAREDLILKTARRDGKNVTVGLEQTGGDSKESALNSVRRLAGFLVKIWKVHAKTTGNKERRADPLVVQWNNGNVRYVKAGWNKDYLEELRFFPFGKNDDQVDASAGAFHLLCGRVTRRAGGIKPGVGPVYVG